MKGRRLQKLVLEYSADSVESCPIEAFDHYVLCGTYDLVQGQSDQVNIEQSTSQRRVGKIYALELEVSDVTSEGSNKTSAAKLKQISSIESGAVLDIKWSSELYKDRPLFASANSEGCIPLYYISDFGDIEMISRNEIFDPSVLCLSLDWSNKIPHNHDPCQIVNSLSNGNLAISIMRSGSDTLSVLKEWKAHDFEAWTCCFDCWNPSIVYSGGDDCRFRGWDIRTDATSVFDIKRNSMGVTSIQDHPFRENILACGSFDESLRLYDKRQISSPITSINVGGGVWRLKWNRHNPDLILAATMHNGFHILDISENVTISTSYLEHESLAYGADWISDSDYVATCSFYDRSLHLWRY